MSAISAQKKVVPVIIEGLRKLEYRGYDSAGIAVVNAAGKMEIRRAPGKLRNLEEAIQKAPLDGIVISVVTEGDHLAREASDHIIELPPAPELLATMLEIVPLQLLAYQIAIRRGCDVDQPRNLAKSVTVE